MSRTLEHQQHIASRTAYNTCPECSADRERRFVSVIPFRYSYVREYLSYAVPRLAAFKADRGSMDARWWYRDFLKAMDRRINSHNQRQGRKYADGYLDRLRMVGRGDESYLRRFAQRGASCLDV